MMASVALVVLSPPLALVSLLVLTIEDSPILFRQTRAGYGGRPFTLLKSRTMSNEYDCNGNLLSDAMVNFAVLAVMSAHA